VATMLEFNAEFRRYGFQFPDHRSGQAAFNTLHRVAPELADKIRGTTLDPFHKTDLLDEFFDWLTDRLSPSPSQGGGTDE
jgi:hypothetical protein